MTQREQCLVFPRASLISSCCKRLRKSRARAEHEEGNVLRVSHKNKHTFTNTHMQPHVPSQINSVLLSFSIYLAKYEIIQKLSLHLHFHQYQFLLIRVWPIHV